MDYLEKLLSIASPPLSEAPVTACLIQSTSPLHAELKSLLELRNGFIAFESALVVFPSSDADGVLSLTEWNAPDGWRRMYSEVLPPDAVCFAHDLFGGQFAATNAGVMKFDPETGELKCYGSSLEEWAARLLENYREDTAWPLAHEWQMANRSLSPSERLIPIQPFVLGGDYAAGNLVSVSALTAMEKWGRLFTAIRDVPDGGKVTLSEWV